MLVIMFVGYLIFALRFVVGNAWLMPTHEYANNGVRGYLMIAGAANEGGEYNVEQNCGDKPLLPY